MRSDRDTALCAAGIALATALGAWLRFRGAATQVLVNDELHLVYAIVKLPLAEIARSWVFEGADYSVPLGLLFRALSDRGVRLSELALRMPMLASGVALVALLPWAVRRRIGGRAAVALALLLATAPLLVYYSRLVRSYMPLLLVGYTAVWAAQRWAEGRELRFAAAYVGCAALAIYLHLVAAPFVLAPALLWVDDWIATRSRARIARDALVLASLALLAGALLAPARESIAWVVAARREAPESLASGVGGALALLAGRPPRVFAGLFWALLARGLWVGLRGEQRRFHVALLVVAACQVAAVIVLSPQQIGVATVFARYCLLVLPIALLWVAVGLAEPWAAGPRWLRAAGSLVVAAAFALGVIGQGVLAQGGSWRPSFGNFSFFELRDAPRPAGEEPPFYRELGRERPSGVLLEAPWHHLLFTRMLAAHQRVHGQEILVSYLRGFPVNDARLRLRTAVRPEPAAFLRSRARYLVLHLDPGREERSFDPQGRLPFASGSAESIERSLAQHAAWAEAVCRHLTAQWGPPTYRDESLCVFDLDDARATAALAPLPDP
jgi:hypothetical protein